LPRKARVRTSSPVRAAMPKSSSNNRPGSIPPFYPKKIAQAGSTERNAANTPLSPTRAGVLSHHRGRCPADGGSECALPRRHLQAVRTKVLSQAKEIDSA
jgi:hypothetical protein